MELPVTQPHHDALLHVLNRSRVHQGDGLGTDICGRQKARESGDGRAVELARGHIVARGECWHWRQGMAHRCKAGHRDAGQHVAVLLAVAVVAAGAGCTGLFVLAAIMCKTGVRVQFRREIAL
ncbi:MAG: hypothetical protein DI589_26315 [Shinella sp.]|nr:MAG: hypothetical protein DI589_26315 [Shinella sp.]